MLCVVYQVLVQTKHIIKKQTVEKYEKLMRQIGVFFSIEYVEFDGHEYVYLKSGHGRSLCHSPKCKCLNNN